MCVCVSVYTCASVYACERTEACVCAWCAHVRGCVHTCTRTLRVPACAVCMTVVCVLYRHAGRLCVCAHTSARSPGALVLALVTGVVGATAAWVPPRPHAPGDGRSRGVVGSPARGRRERDAPLAPQIQSDRHLPFALLSTLDSGAHSKVGALVPAMRPGLLEPLGRELWKTRQRPSEARPPACWPWRDAGSVGANPINHCFWPLR